MARHRGTKGGPIGRRSRLSDEHERHDQREKREAGSAGEGDVEASPSCQVPAPDADQERRSVDGRPLHGLEGARQTAWPPMLHHQGVGEDVGEGKSQPHERHEQGGGPVRMLAHQGKREAGCRGEGGGQQEVALASSAAERHEVRQEPVGGLDQPGDGRDQEEIGDLAC